MSKQKQLDQHSLDLLQGGVDDELSKDEQEELGALLSGSAEIRAASEKLKGLVDVLDSLPELEPPSYLHESIERQLKVPRKDLPRDLKPGLPASWLSTNWLGTGLALAAGVVLTVGIYQFESEPMSDMDTTKLSGTVIKNSALRQGELVDRIQISGEVLNGLVELRKNADFITLDVQLDSDGPSELVVDYLGRGLEFEGISQDPEFSETVTVADGHVNVLTGGGHQYLLKLRRISDSVDQQTTPLELEFFANNGLVEKASLNIY